MSDPGTLRRAAVTLTGFLSLAAVACGSGGDGDAPARAAVPPGPPAASSAPPPAASPSVQPAAQPLAAGWELAELAGGEGAGAVRLLAGGASGAVALSHTASGCCGGQVSVWAGGADGGWTRALAAGVAALFQPGSPASFPIATQVTRSGFVAVGGQPAGTADPRPVPAAWTSPDGLRWSVAAVPDDPSTGGGALGAVSATAEGLVAFGSAEIAGPAFVLRSADGTAWQTEPLPPGLENAMSVQWGSDAAIAWGATAGPDGSPVAALWQATGDGWQHSNASHLGDEMVRVLPFGEGWAAFGNRFEPVGHGTTATFAAVYLSDDGARWEHVLRVGELQDMLASRQHGLLAVGVDGEGGPVLWASADGRDWTAAAKDAFEVDGGDTTLHAITELPDGRVLVGGVVAASDDGPGDAAVWVWSP